MYETKISNAQMTSININSILNVTYDLAKLAEEIQERGNDSDSDNEEKTEDTKSHCCFFSFFLSSFMKKEKKRSNEIQYFLYCVI